MSKRGDDSDSEAKHKIELKKLTDVIENMGKDHEEKLSTSKGLHKGALIDLKIMKAGVSAKAASDSSLEVFVVIY